MGCRCSGWRRWKKRVAIQGWGVQCGAMHSGRLPTHSLVQIVQFAFGGTRAPSLSGVLAGRVARGVLGEFDERCGGFGLSKYRHKPTGIGGEQLLPPRLALVSHAIAHQVALIADSVQGMAVEDRTVGTVVLLKTIALLVSATEAMGDGPGAGCAWLRAYCEFVRGRFRRGSVSDLQRDGRRSSLLSIRNKAHKQP
jgi:hypothetical protein